MDGIQTASVVAAALDLLDVRAALRQTAVD